MYIFISIITIVILFFGVKYLFITRINIDDITIEINNNYDFDSKKGKLRGKDIELTNTSNVNSNKLGDYEVIFESHEKYAINSKKKVKVHVVDDEKPIITLKGENEIIINYKEEYKEAGYTATDNYDGDITDKVTIQNNVDNTKLGNYEVIYKVIDSSNNETTIKRNVIVKDTEKPIIKLNRNINSYVILNKNINLNDFTANDNYDGDITDKVTVEGTVNTKKIGLYKILYKVKDSSGNETILETTVNVQKKNTKGIPVSLVL